MAKGLNKIEVGLEFSADTQQAKKQIQDLQQSLTKLTANVGKTDRSLGFSKEIHEAIGLTTQLQAQLIKATNVDTGKLDLGKFSDSLKKSNITLKQYQQALSTLGPQGNQAFSQLAIAIMGAEVPIRRINSALQETFVSLKNTARWQISSSVLHGFMGAIQSAYGYAQDLNESLNDIRIVTGYNTDQMAKFAKEANKAAKALSATTTEYTNASLIYFQQGLDDQQVKERTDITVKMANVSKQSAETVSDQMTAVWNNFYDGSKSLEYYADVMTKLGAATASSSDEIAQGLEKFAAIADTVGLSYDYAASALATVTAETRQSADVVGTAFKTIFARIEGLSLGETLEDGTDLNKYSQALSTVGVEIKDTNGEMKNMDTILEEMGSRWQTLGQDQKIALAQTVAGVRQYNQLIALMDNWGTFQENLSTAQNSQGALQEQADIYAESWEAARDRVTASAETIYENLINDDFFIDLNNALADTLDMLNGLIDLVGGLPGILSIIGTLVTKIFSNQIATSLENMVYNIKMLGDSGKKSYEQLKTEANVLLQKQTSEGKPGISQQVAGEAYAAQGASQQALLQYSKELTEEETKQLQLLLDQQQAIANKLISDGQELEAEQKKTAMVEARLKAQMMARGREDDEGVKENQKKLKQVTDLYYQLSTFDVSGEGLKSMSEEGQRLQAILENLVDTETNLFSEDKFGQKGAEGLQNLRQALQNGDAIDTTVMIDAMSGLEAVGITAFDNIIKRLRTMGYTEKEATKIAEQLRDQYETLGDKTADVTEGQLRLNNATKNFSKSAQTAAKTGKTLAQNFVKVGQSISQTAMLINNIKGLIDTLNNQDLSFGEKLTATFMSLGMILPNTVSLFKDVISTGQDIKNWYVAIQPYQIAQAALMKQENIDTLAKVAAQRLLNSEDQKATANAIANSLVKKGIISDSQKELFIQTLLTNAKSADNAEDMKSAVIDSMVQTTQKSRIATKWAELGATTANTLAESNNIVVKLLNNAASALATFVTKQLAKAKGEETAAVIANTGAWLTNPIGWIAAVIAGIVAILALLVGGIVAVTQAIDNNSVSLEEASENAQKAAENCDQVTQAYENLKSAIEEVNNLEDPFKNLSKGTAEWNLALLEANNKITDLISKYPELAKYIEESSNVEGLKVISEEGQEKILEEQAKKVGAANARKYAAQAVVHEISASEALKDKEGKVSVSYSGDSGTSYLASDGEQKLIDKMSETGMSAVEAAKELGFYTELSTTQSASLTASLEDNNAELTAAAQEVAKNNEALRINTEALIRNANTGNEAYDKSSYKEFIDSKNIDEETETEKGNLEKLTTDEFWDEYEKYLNETGEGEYRIVDRKGKATVEKRNEAGSWDTYGDKNTLERNVVTEEMAKYKAAQFDETQITSIEEEAQSYKDWAKNNIKADGQTLTQDQIDKVALAAYQAAQNNTTFDITKVLEGAEISISGNEHDDLLGVQNNNYSTKSSGFTEDQQKIVNSASKFEEGKQLSEEYKASLGALAELEHIQQNAPWYALEKYYPNIEESIALQKEIIKEQENELQMMALLSDAAEKYELDQDELLAQSKQLAKQYGLDAKAAAQMAVENQRMNKGVVTLVDNWEEWSIALKAGDKTSQDWAKAAAGCTKAVADLVGASEELELPTEFFESEKNLTLLEEASKGSEKAINELGFAVTSAQIQMLEFNSTMTDINGNAIDLDQFEEWKTTLFNGIDTVQNKLDSLSVGQDIGEDLGTKWVGALNEMAIATEMSVDEMNSLLNSMGVQAEVTTKEVPQKIKVPVYTTTEEVTENTSGAVTTYTKTSRTVQTGVEEMDGVISVAQINTGDDVGTAPKITYTGNGNVSTSAKGGGSATKPTKAKKTKKTEVVERYKEITDTLDDISDSLEKLNKQSDRLYGAARIKAMQEQLKVLKQEEKALEQKRREAEAYLKIDKQLLLAEAKKQGLNFSFDENGNITNIESELEKRYAELSAAEDKYNSMASKELQDAYEEDTLEPLREEIGELKDAITQYYETVETIEDIDVALQDNDYAQEDTELAMIEYAVEVQLEVDERQFKQLERLLKRIEDRAFSAADAIANLGLQASSTIDSLDVNKQGISDILKKNGLTDEEIEGFLKGDQAVVDKVSGMEFSAGDIEALKTFMDGLTESVDLLVEIRKQVHDKILSAFEECNETIDKGIEKLNYLKSVTESFANIIDLLGKANFKGSTELIKQLNEAQVAQSGDIAKANIAKRDMMATNLANAKATLEQQRHKLSEEEIKMWEDSIAEMESQLQDAELEAMSSIEAWMQAINDAFIAEIEASIERFSDTVAGEFKSLSQLQEAFDRRSDLADNYLQDYQKIYEFSKLNRDIENSIDHTDSIAGKKTLLELTEKITALEESGAKVSQYQVDSLRAQYELKMAQIALEEAQNAKTQVIRRRDEEGNYGYVYTADQEALGEAYQTYEDKLYAWQELNQTFIQETQEAMIGLQAEMEQKMMEIAQDESLSVDERKAKMAELYAYYEEQFNYYKEQLGVGFEDAQLIYNDDWTKYAESTGYKISADENFIDSFGETQLSMLTGFETMEEYQAAFNQASETLLDESIDAFNTWQSDMENGPLAAMGTTFEDFAEDVGDYLDDVQQSSDETRQQVQDDAELMKGTYQDVLDAIVVWEDQYSQFIQRVVDESDNLINAFNTILTLWAQVNNIANSGEEDQPTQEDQPTKEEQDKALAARAAEIVKGVHYGTIKQTNDGWQPSAKAAGYTDEEIALALKVINDSKAGWSYDYNYRTAMKLLGYDTGGYTGEWGPEGRLALLHQKEIVLNARDTENMLAMTQMVRDIAKRIDLTAVPTNRSIAPTAVASANEGIEQNITIHAEFPDAVNQKEIEEAFNNLFIRVSQYANRKD